METKRNISLYDVKELFFKSEEEMLKIVSNLVKKHYLQNSGELQIWGKIENYQVHLDGRVYVLDTDGNLFEGASAEAQSLARVVLK